MSVVAASGTSRIGGDLGVRRLGFGATRIRRRRGVGRASGPRGRPRVVREAVRLGVTPIDTADSYGPRVSEEVAAEALHPYPDGLVIVTKAGFRRSGPGKWHAGGRPEALRAGCEGSLRRLPLERSDSWQLRPIDAGVPAEERSGTIRELAAEGKIRHGGLSGVSVEELGTAQKHLDVVTVHPGELAEL